MYESVSRKAERKGTAMNENTNLYVDFRTTYLKSLCSTLDRHLSVQQDAAIRQAINNHLGREDWSIEEVKPRLKLHIYQESNQQILTMDDESILVIGPVKMNVEKRGRSTFLQATRGYKIFNETNGKSSQPEGLG